MPITDRSSIPDLSTVSVDNLWGVRPGERRRKPPPRRRAACVSDQARGRGLRGTVAPAFPLRAPTRTSRSSGQGHRDVRRSRSQAPARNRPMNRHLLPTLWLALIACAAVAAEAPSRVWRTRGFDEFPRRHVRNAGENLYVSRRRFAGAIAQYDFNRDGRFDLVLCNSLDLGEQAPAYVYADPLGSASGSNYPPTARWPLGVRPQRRRLRRPRAGNAQERHPPGPQCVRLLRRADGLSERGNSTCRPRVPLRGGRRFQRRRAPRLAFLRAEDLRVFFQTELGFEPKRFATLAIPGNQSAAATWTTTALPTSSCAGSKATWPSIGAARADSILRALRGPIRSAQKHASRRRPALRRVG